MAKVVDLAAKRGVGDSLGDLQLGRVLFGGPIAARQEELGLVAVEARVARVGAGRRLTIDVVLQLSLALDLGQLGATPSGAVRAVRLVGKADWVVPVGGVRLIEGDGVADVDGNIRRGSSVPGKVVVARLACARA